MRNWLVTQLFILLAAIPGMQLYAAKPDATETAISKESLKETNQPDEEQLVVTASRLSLPISATLNDMIIIDRTEIESSAASSIYELLAGKAGLDLVRKGGPKQEASLFIRGTNANHLLILMDEIEIGSATLGLKALADIDLEQIERIELLKGPRAALWGGKAMGGVLQIFSRETTGQNLSLSMGSFGQRQLSFIQGLNWEATQMNFQISRSKLTGYDTRLDGDNDADGAERTSVLINGWHNVNEATTLLWRLNNTRGLTEFDTLWGGDILDFDNHLMSLGLKFQDQRNQHEFTLAQQRDYSLTLGNNNPALGFETRSQTARYLGHYSFSEHWNLGTSLEWKNEDIGRSDSAYLNNDRDVVAGHLYSHYRGEQWLNEVAVRYTDVEGIASNNSYNLGVGYQLTADQLLSVNLGEGFKAPTFNDLYYPYGGNPALDYETSLNKEIVYKINQHSFDLSLSLFDNRIENLIQWLPDNNGIWSPQNVGKAKFKGLDLSLSWQLNQITQQLTLGYVDARDELTQNKLKLRADKQVQYQISGDWQSLSGSLTFRYVGQRPDTDYLTYSTVNLKDFITTDAVLRYELSSRWKIQLSANDLFNSAGTLASGYRPEGKTWRLGVIYQN